MTAAILPATDYSGFSHGQLQVRLVERDRTIAMLEARLLGMQNAAVAVFPNTKAQVEKVFGKKPKPTKRYGSLARR